MAPILVLLAAGLQLSTFAVASTNKRAAHRHHHHHAHAPPPASSACITPPPALATITGLSCETPQIVTAQGQQVTAWIEQYVVCNKCEPTCSTIYSTSTYKWYSTIVPCYGGESTLVTDEHQVVTFSGTKTYGPVQFVTCESAGIYTVDGMAVAIPKPTVMHYRPKEETCYYAPFNQLGHYYNSNSPSGSYSLTVGSKCCKSGVCETYDEEWYASVDVGLQTTVIDGTTTIIPITRTSCETHTVGPTDVTTTSKKSTTKRHPMTSTSSSSTTSTIPTPTGDKFKIEVIFRDGLAARQVASAYLGILGNVFHLVPDLSEAADFFVAEYGQLFVNSTDDVGLSFTDLLTGTGVPVIGTSHESVSGWFVYRNGLNFLTDEDGTHIGEEDPPEAITYNGKFCIDSGEGRIFHMVFDMDNTITPFPLGCRVVDLYTNATVGITTSTSSSSTTTTTTTTTSATPTPTGTKFNLHVVYTDGFAARQEAYGYLGVLGNVLHIVPDLSEAADFFFYLEETAGSLYAMWVNATDFVIIEHFDLAASTGIPKIGTSADFTDSFGINENTNSFYIDNGKLQFLDDDGLVGHDGDAPPPDPTRYRGKFCIGPEEGRILHMVYDRDFEIGQYPIGCRPVDLYTDLKSVTTATTPLPPVPTSCPPPASTTPAAFSALGYPLSMFLVNEFLSFVHVCESSGRLTDRSLDNHPGNPRINFTISASGALVQTSNNRTFSVNGERDASGAVGLAIQTTSLSHLLADKNFYWAKDLDNINRLGQSELKYRLPGACSDSVFCLSGQGTDDYDHDSPDATGHNLRIFHEPPPWRPWTECQVVRITPDLTGR